jgi:hypothetical protein
MTFSDHSSAWYTPFSPSYTGLRNDQDTTVILIPLRATTRNPETFQCVNSIGGDSVRASVTVMRQGGSPSNRTTLLQMGVHCATSILWLCVREASLSALG